jgi:hypothetical protein
VEPEKNAPEETVVEGLCKRAAAEQDLEKLLKLLIKVQQSTEAPQSRKKPAGGMTGRGAKSESPNS